ncbi:MAG TPA: hypothetical protein VNT99_15975 [Methylomirabilota bacterium]|nr:hypothetical protein [Methylomirabilota bacterium]
MSLRTKPRIRYAVAAGDTLPKAEQGIGRTTHVRGGAGGVALNRDLSATGMKNLSTHLNDHLAGSVAALELLDRLVETYDGKPRARFFHKLRREIEDDQAVLQKLLQKLGAEESKARKAAGWVVEKLSRPKIPLSKAEEGDMGLFLALEALELGITGKHSLWRALAAASHNVPRLAQVDYVALQKRALEQRGRVEVKRLEVAVKVFN